MSPMNAEQLIAKSTELVNAAKELSEGNDAFLVIADGIFNYFTKSKKMYNFLLDCDLSEARVFKNMMGSVTINLDGK